MFRCRCCFDVLYCIFYRCAHAQWRFQPPNMSPYYAFWSNIARFETMERRSFARTLLWRNIHIHDTLLAVYRKFRQISTMAELKEKDFRSQRFEHHSRDEISERKRKKTSTTPKIQLNKFESGQGLSGLFGLIWRKVTITLMFGLKLFLNEALEGFWSGARKQKSDGEPPGSIRAGTVPAISKPFIKPRHSKISIDLNRLYVYT